MARRASPPRRNVVESLHARTRTYPTRGKRTQHEEAHQRSRRCGQGSPLGIEAAHPDLRVDHENRIIFRGDAPRSGKVGLISGGGSGHEPLHGGFVGLGMLDAACAGEVFTSPVPDQMLEATKAVDGGAGVLHIVKNYTGDVMNFEMAAELAAAERRRGGLGRHRRRRRGPGQPLHGRPARRGRRPCSWRRSPVRPPRRAAAGQVADVARQ